jgi:hypothetical protein
MSCLNFTLYLDSTFPRNLWANDIRSLTELCQRFDVGHYSIEIIHLANERQRAFQDGVINTPTILLEQEGGRRKILGNLTQTEAFFNSLTSPTAVARAREGSSLMNLFSMLKPQLLAVRDLAGLRKNT